MTTRKAASTPHKSTGGKPAKAASSASAAKKKQAEEKPERTHEMNQERALIAASHRGDRPLDKRIESAEKASVIHEQRTGRKLVITPEAVKAGGDYDEEGVEYEETEE